MINGFEDETHDLTEEEKKLTRFAWRAMNYAFNAERTITNKEIANFIRHNTGVKVGSPRIRKMINWMHVQGHLPNLIASSNGYGKAKDMKELMAYADSLRGRIKAIQARLDAVKKDISDNNQASLF